MSMELKALTKALCALSGPTGFETPVYDFLSDYLRPVADEIRTDSMGDFIAFYALRTWAGWTSGCSRPGR